MLFKAQASVKAVTKIGVSANERFLFLLSDDGKLYIYDLRGLKRTNVRGLVGPNGDLGGLLYRGSEQTGPQGWRFLSGGDSGGNVFCGGR